MKKIFYEKIGRRYVPVKEYNSEFMDAMSKGTHLIMSYPGGQSCRYNINPMYAPMIAAGRVAEDAISMALYDASSIRMQSNDRKRELTLEQKEAWLKLVEVFGDSGKQLEWPSCREIAETGVKAMEDEAMRLMENPAVKNAYDQFIMICELTKEHEKP